MRAILKTLLLIGCIAPPASLAFAQSTVPVIDGNATVRLPSVPIPFSELATPEAKAAYLRLMEENRVAATKPARTIADQRAIEDAKLIPMKERQMQALAVSIDPQVIAGVQTDVITPKAGIAPRNRNRVLINLHGGGFTTGARFGGQVESIPVAWAGRIKVVTVDYRMAPEHRFPAASEDVVAVYRELLKTYRAENIGIFGCSAGGMLTGQTLAWFQTHGVPRPGAAGIFGSGSQIRGSGDSNYVAAPLMGWPMPPLPPGLNATQYMPYFRGANPNDPVLSPIEHPEILSKFPPTLIVSGTRDIGLSPSLNLHAKLVDAGATAELHVWEAMTHCGFTEPDVPESRQAWKVMAQFFDRYLGTKRK
ncbi:alpha/beta hydrolase [Novosphingobium bradum]|uniref:Alpha/beta hydrolase n=1 Tax=Novosphingobium bradum TaxID=1737444 RepID=A0ABV7IN49_9SPHN